VVAVAARRAARAVRAAGAATVTDLGHGGDRSRTRSLSRGPWLRRCTAGGRRPGPRPLWAAAKRRPRSAWLPGYGDRRGLPPRSDLTGADAVFLRPRPGVRRRGSTGIVRPAARTLPPWDFVAGGQAGRSPARTVPQSSPPGHRPSRWCRPAPRRSWVLGGAARSSRRPSWCGPLGGGAPPGGRSSAGAELTGTGTTKGAGRAAEELPLRPRHWRRRAGSPPGRRSSRRHGSTGRWPTRRFAYVYTSTPRSPPPYARSPGDRGGACRSQLKRLTGGAAGLRGRAASRIANVRLGGRPWIPAAPRPSGRPATPR
jgi:hypothetical protein